MRESLQSRGPPTLIAPAFQIWCWPLHLDLSITPLLRPNRYHALTRY